MFERYNEKARRAIFFARYEAAQYGSAYIESEHLLLGLLREDKALANRHFPDHAAELIREEINRRTPRREKVATSVDLPLTNECKRALAYTAEESENLSAKHIGTEHILLGLFRVDHGFAAKLLKQQGLSADAVRKSLLESAQARRRETPPWQRALANVRPRLGYSTHTVKVADLAASVVFYTKMGFRQIAGRKEDGVVVMTQGFTRLAVYDQSIAERLLCFYGANLDALTETLQLAGLSFRRSTATGSGERDALVVRDLDRNLWYFLAAHEDDDKDPAED